MAQQQFLENIWHRNVILKARQLGFSTLMALYLLDHCLFTSDAHVGIIAHSWHDVKKLFQRVKYAYDHLPQPLKDFIQPVRDSQTELSLSNGSSLSVGLSMRGTTLTMLHVSEFGKICAQYPDKAREILTGAIEAVPTSGLITIESTAEGREGHFYDLCQTSQRLAATGAELTPLDYRFHFFPWYIDPEYRLDEGIQFTTEQEVYFDKLERSGIVLSPAQKCWYVKKQMALGDDTTREYPTTPDEAFLASQNGLIYGQQMLGARIGNRIGNVPLDPSQLVHTAWDLGYSDHTAIWWFQVCGKEVHFIDYYQDTGKSLAEYIALVRGKNYTYGRHLGPHDIEAHELQTGQTRRTFAKNLGLDFSVVPRVPDLTLGIDAVRGQFGRFWFDQSRCAAGIKCLDNYKKRWVSSGYWSSEPLHDENSHGASALMTCVLGLDQLGQTGFTADQIAQIRAYRRY